MRRCVIIGAANHLSYRDKDALEPYTPSGAGERLWDMVNLVHSVSKRDYVKAFTFVNLVPRGRWDAVKARELGPAMIDFVGSRHALVLGRDVWKALGFSPVRWFSRVTLMSSWTLLPHPSGRNRLYNEELMRRRVGKILAAEGRWR